MSAEMHVLFRGKLPDKRALSRAMAELGFPLTIAAGLLERQRGFMPMRLRREETGVEFDVFDDRAAVEEPPAKASIRASKAVPIFAGVAMSMRCWRACAPPPHWPSW
jgi:hypothetical protein